jgi:hypothetical protein
MSQASASYSIDKSVAIKVHGAGIVATVNYQCSPTDTSASLSLMIVENVGGPTASASGSNPYGSQLSCDDTTHSMQLTMSATNRAFRDGKGFATGSLDTCSAGSCSSADAYRTVVLDDGDGSGR